MKWGLLALYVLFLALTVGVFFARTMFGKGVMGGMAMDVGVAIVLIRQWRRYPHTRRAR